MNQILYMHLLDIYLLHMLMNSLNENVRKMVLNCLIFWEIMFEPLNYFTIIYVSLSTKMTTIFLLKRKKQITLKKKAYSLNCDRLWEKGPNRYHRGYENTAGSPRGSPGITARITEHHREDGFLSSLRLSDILA